MTARLLYVRLRSLAFRGARESLYVLLRWSGTAALARRLTGRKVAILLYHNPSAATLSRHFRYLARTSKVIPLDRLVSALEKRDWARIPKRAVVVTFDDGHAANRELLELFVRYHVRPTIYVCSQLVDTRRRFWWTVVGPHTRRQLGTVPNTTRLRTLREDFGFLETHENGDRQALSLTELREMSRAVDIGAHTRFHPLLTRCTEEECTEEIAGSRREIRSKLGGRCAHFAYPSGAYGDREVAAVRAAGFASARTIDIGWNDVHTDRYRLKILGLPDDASVSALAVQLAGIPFLRDLVFLR